MSTPVGIDLGTGERALGTIAFRGPDAAKFLQGQVSADIEKLASGTSTWAGLHNPQGRALAILWLARLSPEEVIAVLPRELVADLAAHLRKYVFRAKVVIEVTDHRVIGAVAGADPHGCFAFRWGDRQLLLADPARELALSPDRAAWELADVREGLPQVYAATREEFVAQMLNLDLLGAIGFDKGCYTGQEVIARAHYRGRVKRRMQRWFNSGAPLLPGAAARSTDGRPLSVVRVAPDGNGGEEVLAVGTFGPAEPAVESGVPLVEPRPLPYALPE